MNSEKACDPKVGRSNVSFVENIYSIIDSKIQYLDYKTQELVRPLIGENTTEKSVGKSKMSPPENLKIEEELFLHFEKQSKMKKLLLLLRNYLNKENALLVLSLLADDQLLKSSQKDIEYRLDVSKRNQAA